ncbi:CBS domain-containing protein [Halobellus litoreus]|uniref:Cyclic nucleotide-binding/CBS domain-containing protein n=1 Tax=Halobellus litoreus TaxID=755310 RepID=A0ABD6DZ01_9EURY|nr:CBS domain-containing protein [Halobellus litoreus]
MVELYVDQIMSRPVETVSPTTTLGDAAETMIRHDVGAVVAVDDSNGFEGILTATDFVLLAMEGSTASDVTVAESMRTDVVTTQRTAPATDVVDAMLEELIHHVPVVDGNEVVGMVTTFDLAAYLGRSLEP